MWDTQPPRVLVGVESLDCDAALTYAVGDALRRGCGIHLVHVAHPSLSASCALDDIALVDGELRRTDQMVLSAAEARVHTLVREQGDDEGPSVSSELNHGPVVADLARLSRHASRLVLEHRHERSGAEVIPVSTTAGLAVVAHCPVVVVHPRWRPSTTGTVVVGIDDLSRASSVLEVADREAVARGARLRVVTVTSDPGTAPDVDSLPDTASDAEHVVRTGNVADALLAEARDSELLVVGRHHRNHLLGVPLGRTVHHLLGHSPVPLLIVDPAARGGRS